MTIRVLLADDHQLLRELIRRRLQEEPDIVVVGEAADGRELIRRATELAPDVVLVDIGMPELNGIDATARLTRRHPGLRILCLSAHTEPAYVRAVLEAGAAGYLDKSAPSVELIRAVRVVAGGQAYLSTQAAGIAVETVCERGTQAQPRPALLALGRREREVLQLIAEGLSTADVAERLSLSPATVDTHRRNIMRKLGTHSAVELTRLAIREGLVEL